MTIRNRVKKATATASIPLLAAGALGLGLLRNEEPAIASDAVTVESPFSGSLTSHPSEHHTVFTDPGTGMSADFAADIGAAAGTDVRPRVSGPTLEMVVVDTFPTCQSSDGGQTVRAVLKANGREVGWAAWGHLSDVAVQPGQSIDAETVIGRVGSFDANETCWTGPHTHLEVFEYDHTDGPDFACYAPVETGQELADRAPVGVVGEVDADGPKQAC